MSLNEIKIESRDSISSVSPFSEFIRDRANSLRPDETEKLDQQFDEVPIWENRFVDMIEKMRTVPYVMLGHFEFITVNWIEDTVEDSQLIPDKVIVEEDKRANHWDLVKRMIFSKASKNLGIERALSKERTGRGQSSTAHRKGSIPNFVSQQIVNQFNNVYDYIKDFISSRKASNRKENDRSKEERKKFKVLNAFKSAKNSIKNRLNRNRLVDKLKRKSRKYKNSESKRFDKKEEIESKEENSISKKRRRLLSRQNLSKFSQRLLGGRKDFIIDLSELATSKRFLRLNSIMSRDDGPFVTDYRFLLGIDFWSSFCGVEKYQLIWVCPNNFWIKELNSYQSSKGLKENHKSKSKSEYSVLSELKQFLKGTDKPARAPQRVISSEEKFRLIPYPKLFNPNTDLKKTFHSNTIQDQLDKKLKRIYKALVYLIGGKYPLIRPVGFEEAYEDRLLWVLDTYQAKTRFIALLNNQIKWEIN